MERVSGTAVGEADGPEAMQPERRCLKCGRPVPDRPRGCKSGHCVNCNYPYPLGDCSD